MTRVISYKKTGTSRFSVVAARDELNVVHVRPNNAKDGRPEVGLSFKDAKSGRVFDIEIDADDLEKIARMILRGSGRGMNELRAKFAPEEIGA